MTRHSDDKDRDASWQVFEALRTAPEPIRRSAREAIEAGNQETFLTLVTDFLRMPTSGRAIPRIANDVLDRVDWDWLAGVRRIIQGSRWIAGWWPDWASKSLQSVLAVALAADSSRTAAPNRGMDRW